ncbi:hypothetical protein SNE510_39890 [Streptomyces sp. NE5-10]|uniref:Uncharacterized protein n=1 Tax=Streptomyces hydrogenans TaxID=1873719 RepID=A0ABQ3P3W5_9ACTN|nr:hypothetical protein GCM10018784_58240 [Streptomyces hydrogenans]GHI19711.1 hypothetical protein Shyd_10820 [Streptomyces hydrogenans]GHJ94470.1 hypothetical protein SNE510_39890 [Streptomyces sp. NE5-10]
MPIQLFSPEPVRRWVSGERRLCLGYVEVDAVEQRLALMSGGSGERVVLGLDPYELGFQILDALLKPSHLGEESRVGAADVTEKRLCHDEWSSTLSDRPIAVWVVRDGFAPAVLGST